MWSFGPLAKAVVLGLLRVGFAAVGFRGSFGQEFYGCRFI